jgi:hypothetical protein
MAECDAMVVVVVVVVLGKKRKCAWRMIGPTRVKGRSEKSGN